MVLTKCKTSKKRIKHICNVSPLCVRRSVCTQRRPARWKCSGHMVRAKELILHDLRLNVFPAHAYSRRVHVSRPKTLKFCIVKIMVAIVIVNDRTYVRETARQRAIVVQIIHSLDTSCTNRIASLARIHSPSTKSVKSKWKKLLKYFYDIFCA